MTTLAELRRARDQAIERMDNPTKRVNWAGFQLDDTRKRIYIHGRGYITTAAYTSEKMKKALIVQERRQMAEFVRMLANYGCAGIDQDVNDTSLCGKCGTCRAIKWLEDRQMDKPPSLGELTEREAEILRELPSDDWVRPLDVGGSDGSDHSAILARLVIKGYAEMKARNAMSGSRSGHKYRKLYSADGEPAQ